MRAACPEPTTKGVAAGGGQVLFLCSRIDAVQGLPLLLDVATHEVREIAGVQALNEETERAAHGSPAVVFTDVGAAGVRFVQRGGKLYWEGALDVRTGVVRRLNGTGETYDLDDPALVRPLCAPLRAVADPVHDYPGKEYTDVWIDGQIGVTAPWPTYDKRGPLLELVRCGSRARTALQLGRRWTDDLSGPRIGSGLIAWGHHVTGVMTPRAHVVACGRTYSLTTTAIGWYRSDAIATAPVRDALVVSRLDEAAQTWNVERVPLAGLCGRSAAAERLTLAAGGKRVAASARSGSIADAATGATTAVKRAAGSARTLRVRAGAPIRVTTGAPAASVRWSVAGGRTHHASGRGRSWRLTAPAKPGTRPLRVVVRDRAGGSVTFAARVTTTRR